MANEDGPAGLSTKATPTALRALGGNELAADELDDLVDRRLGREARRLAVPASSGLGRDRRDVDLVVARAQRDAARRPFAARRLADERDHLRSLDGPQVVDDP